MARHTRFLSVALASALTVASLAACGGNGGSAGTASPATDGGTTAATDNGNGTEAEAVGGIPTTSDQVTGEISLENVKSELTVGVDNPHYLFHHDILMADHLGYFEEYGINSVRIVESDDPMPALVGGSLDFMLFDTDGAIAAGGRGADVRFLQVYLGGENNILGVREGINSAEDLKGATITGGQLDSRNTFLLRKLLLDNGVDPDNDVTIVATGGQSNQRLQAIIAGTVDAATIQPRHELLLKEEGGSVLFKELTTAPQVGFSTTQRLIDESPDTVAAFQAAILKARAYINDLSNKDEILDFLSGEGFETPQAFRDAWEDESNDEYHTGDGGFEIADMDEFIQEQIDFDEIPEGTDWKEFVNPTGLWTAQKALGLDLRPTPEEFAAR